MTTSGTVEYWPRGLPARNVVRGRRWCRWWRRRRRRYWIDVERAMRLAGAEAVLSPERETLLKINISWQHWYPGCSTTPWQLEGVIRGLHNMGHQDLIAAHNGTVVVDSFEGEVNNKHKPVQDKYNLRTHAPGHSARTVGALRAEGRDAGPGRYLSGGHRDTRSSSPARTSCICPR